MNPYTLRAFYDELTKIADLTQVLKPVGNFALTGERAISHTPVSAILGETGALRGGAGRLGEVLRKAETVSPKIMHEGRQVAMSAEEAAKHTNLEQLLASGKITREEAANMMKAHRPSPVIPKNDKRIAPDIFASQEATGAVNPEEMAAAAKRMSGAAPAAPAAAPAAVQQYAPPMAMNQSNLQRLRPSAPAAAPAAPAAAPAPVRSGWGRPVAMAAIPAAAAGLGGYELAQAQGSP